MVKLDKYVIARRGTNPAFFIGDYKLKKVPTMLIESETGPVMINTVDFDSETMKAYEPPKAKEPKKLTKKQQAAFDAKAAERDVAERDGKFYIVDGNGTDVEDPAIAADGYDTKDAAQAIVTALTATS